MGPPHETVGGNQVMADMFQGAEAYLETRERADGVRSISCLSAGMSFSASGLGRALRLGDTSRAALWRAGQPAARPGHSFRYCLKAGAGTGARLASVFNAAGRVALIVTGARRDRAAGIAPGAPAKRLRRVVTRRASGSWVSRRALAHGARYVYVVGGNHVRTVGVALAPELRRVAHLRADLRVAEV